tara:strand:+ start:449 stop:646 length:198 start_codon:yes stop_codon:yes gene_type:complete
MEQGGPKKRIRINISKSVKGVMSHDSTVEYYDMPLDADGDEGLAALAESDALVAELEKRYPAPEA